MILFALIVVAKAHPQVILNNHPRVVFLMLEKTAIYCINETCLTIECAFNNGRLQ